MPLYYHGLIIIVNDDLCTRVVSNSHTFRPSLKYPNIPRLKHQELVNYYE